MSAPDLLIDPELKLWVIFPIFCIVLLMYLVRSRAEIVFQPNLPKLNIKELREKMFLTYGASLKENSFNLTEEEFWKRAQPLIKDFREEKYLANSEEKSKSIIPSLTDPKGVYDLIGGVQKQVFTYIPQALTMQWISACFGNFIVVKLPFPLIARFKGILQANINTYDLDVRWISSFSLYLLFNLIMGYIVNYFIGGDYNTPVSPATDVFTPLASTVDKKKLFQNEADALEIEQPKYILDGVRERVLKMAGETN